MKNTTARYIHLTSSQNTDNRNDMITKITVYSKDKNKNHCKMTSVEKIIFSDDSLLFKSLGNYDIIGSYQVLFDDLKKISEYRTEAPDLNGFTKLFSPDKYRGRYLELKTNY